MTEGRRTLQFNSIDDVMPDVEKLLEGHTTVGKWSLSEICRHLSATIRRAVDAPASTTHDPALLFSPEAKAKVFATGKLKEGLPAPPALALPEAANDQEAAEHLRKAIDYYKASAGPAAPHRYFGTLTKDEWDRLQCIHCAHHLSFAVPSNGS